MVAVTEGILHVLDEDELEGVLAHELSHVKNRDVLIATVAATRAGAITYLAQMAQWAAIFGGSRRDDGRGGGNPVALLMMAILAPIAALLVQLAISRAREFQADASGAKLAGRTSGLGRALAKLAAASKTARLDAHPATAHLFIVNPLNGQALTRLFSTHPRSRSGLRGFARCAYEHARRPGDQPVSAKRPRGDTEMRTRWIAIAMMTVGLMLASVMVGAQMAPGGGMGPMPGGMGMGGMMQMQGMMQQMQGMMQQMAEMMKAGAMSAEQTKRMGEVMEEMTGAMGEMHGMMSPRGPGARDPRAMHEQMARMQQRMAEMQKHMAEMMGKMPGATPGASAPEKK